MKVEQEIINAIIGELLTKEKYTFVENKMIANIVRDVFEQLEKERF
jgi:hypothetical protein